GAFPVSRLHQLLLVSRATDGCRSLGLVGQAGSGSSSRQRHPRAYLSMGRQAVLRKGGDMALPVRRSAGAPLAVEQWDPFRELIQGVFGNTMQNGQSAFIPRFDIEESEDAWIVEAELPGVKRKDVDVEVRDGELLITGEIKERERV